MEHAIPQNRPLAIALMLLAAVFIAGTTLIAKMLGGDQFGAPLHPLQITHGRFIFALLALGCAAAVLRPRFGKIHWRLHLMRTTCGAGGVTLMFASVAFIPLAAATAISFLNPVFAMIFAIFLLGEKVGRVRWSAAAIALAGMLLLLRPLPGDFEPAALLALGAAIVLGLEVIFIKRLSGVEGPFQILLVNNCIGVVLSTLAVLAVWQAPTLAQWGLLAALGTMMAGAQTCFVNAMKRAEASFVVPFSYATLVVAGLYDFAFFRIVPDTVALIGMATILCGAGLLAWREARLKEG
ncbi:MAG: DMT family transporter [Pseudomonadota bacterium]